MVVTFIGIVFGLSIERSKLWWLHVDFLLDYWDVHWYYGYFFVLSAALILVSALLLKQRIQWKQIGLAALVSWLVIAPVAYIYWQNWNLVPGVDEGAFPSPDAFADAMTLSGSWIAPFGRTAGAVQSIPTLCLTTIGCLQLRRLNDHQRWGMFSALICCTT